MCSIDGLSPVQLLRAGLAGVAGLAGGGSGASAADVIAALRAGLDLLAEVDVTGLPAAVVGAELRNLLAAVNALDAITATWVGSFEARDLADADGCRSARTWLGGFGRMSQGAAAGWLARGRLLGQLPALGKAARRGQVSPEQVTLVSRLAGRVGVGALSRFDTILAELAAAAGPAEVGRACERIYHHLDPDGPAPDPNAEVARRELTLARSGSMLYLRGRLDAEAGAALQTALDALTAPPRPDDDRTSAQRRADALAELARQALRDGRLPCVGGTRPQLGILVTAGMLHRGGEAGCPHHDGNAPRSPATHRANAAHAEGGHAEGGAAPPGPDSTAPPRHEGAGPPGRAADPLTAAGVGELPELPWLSWAGQVPAELAQRLACDCEVNRILLDPATGLPLYFGRSRRLVPAHLRKALHARDRGCRWPGCDVPAAWTDAHHLTPWYQGGKTNIDNMLLVCRYHHSKIHEGGWRIHLDPATGELHVWRPDGTPYDLQPSQPWVTPSTRRRPDDRR